MIHAMTVKRWSVFAVAALVLLGGCKKSRSGIEIGPKKTGGAAQQTQSFSPWTADEIAHESQICQDQSKQSVGEEAAKNHCQCLVETASSLWSYFEYSSNISNLISEAMGSESYKTCMAGMGTDPNAVKIQAPTSAWGAKAELLEQNNESPVVLPRVVMAPDATAMAVYGQSVGGKSKFYSKLYSGGWKPAIEIPVDATNSGINSPEIAYSGAGEWVVAWAGGGLGANNQAYLEIIANVYNAKDGWRKEALFISDKADPEQELHPQLASNCGGDVVAVWEKTDHGIVSNRYIKGDNWKKPVLISADIKAAGPVVTCLTSGEVIAAWTQPGAGGPYFTTYDAANDKWSAPQHLAETLKGTAGGVQVNLNAQKRAMFVWQQKDGSNVQIMALSRDVDGTLGTPVAVNKDLTAQAGTPAMATDQNGNVMAMWNHAAADMGVWGAYFDQQGKAWHEAVNINNGQAAIPAKQPSVVFDQYGRAIAVWTEFNGTTDNVLSARYDNGSWGKKTEIENEDYGATEYLRLSTDGRDTVIAVWKQEDNVSNKNLYGNVLKP